MNAQWEWNVFSGLIMSHNEQALLLCKSSQLQVTSVTAGIKEEV